VDQLLLGIYLSGWREHGIMKKPHFIYEPHLVLRQHAIVPKGEWTPRLAGPTFILVRQGTGYFLKSQLNQELPVGTVLMLGGGVTGTIRASQIGAFSLCFFSVIPSRLSGLLTLGEKRSLELTLLNPESNLKIFPPQSTVAIRMEELAASENPGGFAARLKMLQLMAEIIELDLSAAPAESKISDAGQRLELFLKQTPISDLLEMNFTDLARMTNCTSRHLSRLFQKLVGMSFNDKRAELRLAKALDLLATSNLKVVDVALESGFKSLSQFNQVFARHFGVSPGRWRNKNGGEAAVVIAKKLKNFGRAKSGKLIFKLNTSRKPRQQTSPSELNALGV
jgi:AraC-like DNA-binding protein